MREVVGKTPINQVLPDLADVTRRDTVSWDAKRQMYVSNVR